MRKKSLKSLSPKGKTITVIIAITAIVLIVFLFKQIVQAITTISKNKKTIENNIYKTIIDKTIPIIDVSMNSKVSSKYLTWPLKGIITSGFGMRDGTFHQGIDIAAPTGTPVYAFMNGKVVFNGWESGYGNLIIIDHENGMKSYYGHNSKLIAGKGQQVSKGQCISEVGSTGDSTGPHCHFEIRVNGSPVNPLNYLNQAN